LLAHQVVVFATNTADLRCSTLLATCQRDLAAAEMEAASCLKTAAIATAKLNEQVFSFGFEKVKCLLFILATQESVLHALQTRVLVLETELATMTQQYSESCAALENLQLESVQSNDAVLSSATAQAHASTSTIEVTM
jgi:hypothetical protein